MYGCMVIIAPEIVTGTGHGKGVDWWTLGIFIYEMLASYPPYFDDGMPLIS
jgi:serine/threonine protein kinase